MDRFAPPSWSDIQQAHDRIRPHIHKTPVITSRLLDARSERSLFFKAENLQRVGAFKIRGALNAVLSLPTKPPRLVTHSSGNHAQALALAGQIAGIPVTVVMPETAPKVKIAAVRDYGADIVMCAPTQEAREDAAGRVTRETGARFIHPYDDPNIIAGAATAAVELLEEVPDLEAIVAPVGGGGLLSGTALATAANSPAEIYGAEPRQAQDAARSLRRGSRLPVTNPDTIADGLRTSLSESTFDIIQAHVSAIIVVSEDAIRDATWLLLTRTNLVVEPSAAVPLAAVLTGKIEQQRIGVILSGGNLDWANLGNLQFPREG